MSDTSIDTAFDEITAPLAEEQKIATIAEIIEISAGNVAIKENIATGIATYEAGFVSFVDQVRDAIVSGITLGEIEAGFKADKAATGTKHFASSKASLTYVDSLGQFLALPGDIPEDIVFRSPGEAPVPEDKQSIWLVVRAICRTEGKIGIYKAARVPYGKGAIEDIYSKATGKQEAWDDLLALKARQERAVKRAATQGSDTEKQESEESEDGPVHVASELAKIVNSLASLYESAQHEDADLGGLDAVVEELRLKADAFVLFVTDADDDDEE